MAPQNNEPGMSLRPGARLALLLEMEQCRNPLARVALMEQQFRREHYQEGLDEIQAWREKRHLR